MDARPPTSQSRSPPEESDESSGDTDVANEAGHVMIGSTGPAVAIGAGRAGVLV